MHTECYSKGSAAASGLQSCHVCGKMASIDNNHCDRCGSDIHVRKPNSLQRTWALVVASIILYIPANTLPIMTTNVFGQESPSTIIGGVVSLWSSGSFPIAIIIFVASVLVPIGKIIALVGLCYSVQYPSTLLFHERTVLYRITEFVGRWSMIDVFVVAVLVSLIQLGNLMSIYPGPAALFFAAVVVLTMLAAMSFDPRLIWDTYDRD